MMSWIGLHKFANLFLGISQKLCYITSSPANEWHAIAPACAHTHQYVFRYAIITHAILCMKSQSHYNISTSVSVILLQRPLLTSVYRHLGGRNENQLCKDFCPIKNKWTNYLHISVQHSDNLRMSHYELMHPQSSCLGFTSFNILSTCLVSKRSLKQCNSTLNIKSISLETLDSSMSLFLTLSCSYQYSISC